ncbi:MAG: TrkA C-terminal domain-containing protein, partial [Pseudomonadota bacterium]
PTLIPLLADLNIDAHINPRASTVSSILRHIRHGRVEGVYSIGEAEAEIIEAKVLSTSPIAGSALRDIDWPEGVLVGAIRKGDQVLRPTGGTRLEDGDGLAIFALSKDVAAVEQLLQVSVDFF